MHRIRPWLVVLPLVCLSGCAFFQSVTGQSQGPQSGDSMQALRDARAAAREQPTDVEAVAVYANELGKFASFRDGPKHAEIEWEASVAEIRTMIDAIVALGDQATSETALQVEYVLIERDGDMQALVEVCKEMYALAPSASTGTWLIDAEAKADVDPLQVIERCAEVYAATSDQEQRVFIIDRCVRVHATSDPREQELAFVSQDDWDAYDAWWAQETADFQAGRQADAARREQKAMSASSGGSSGSGSSGAGDSSGPVSVTLRSECSRTVKVFFGKSTFGSGRQSSISANSRQSVSMQPGDVVWILDDSGKEVSSFSASTSTREATITSSCTGWSVR